MLEESNKLCSRCLKPIICNKEDINNCFCKEVYLSDKTLNFLSKTKYDCLCDTCLEHYNTLMNEVATKSAASMMIPGNLHYYKENGCIVFTELYHATRGFCCKNGCRHCPYGYKSKK